MAVALGNALFQLKKGGILASAIFANLRERQEAKVREGPEREKNSDLPASQMGVLWKDAVHWKMQVG